MAKKRRAARKKRHNRADLRKVTDERDELRTALATIGAPPEALKLLDEADSPEQFIEGLLASDFLPANGAELARGLAEYFEPLTSPRTKPLEAELAGTEFLSLVRGMVDDPAELVPMLNVLLGQVEANASPAALAMLRALAATAPEGVRPEAAAAADRLVAAGLANPQWAEGLGSPEFVSAYGYSDFFGAQEAIGITFRYGHKRHSVLALLDHGLGGGIKDAWVTDRPDRARSMQRGAAAMQGVELTNYSAAQAHAILHEALSKPPCPEQPDQIEDVERYVDLLQRRAALLQPSVPPPRHPPSETAASPTVHRIKVTLRGSRPPIWRRLEVPSRIDLATLHECLQVAFDWHGYHMWVFDTPTGRYGVPEPELGFADATRVRLDQVAAGKGGLVRYTYDFGDDWEHDILVEAVGPAEPGAAYPRCTAGRRVAPPEDCGGIWGYEELLAILADPKHEEHAERLEWLGLNSADEFDPAAFDASDETELLDGLATVLVPAVGQ